MCISVFSMWVFGIEGCLLVNDVNSVCLFIRLSVVVSLWVGRVCGVVFWLCLVLIMVVV